jgi:hypothetical protein
MNDCKPLELGTRSNPAVHPLLFQTLGSLVVFALACSANHVHGFATSSDETENNFTLSGVVVDAQSKPVGDCQVWGYGWNSSMKIDFRETRTDVHGMFTLTLPKPSADPTGYQSHIFAFRQNYIATISTILPRSRDGIRMQLEPCQIVPIQILDEDEQPIAGARISMVSSQPRSSEFGMMHHDLRFIPGLKTESANDGVLHAVVPDWCTRPTIRVSHPDYCDERVEDIDIGQEGYATIVLQRGTEIQIQLRTQIQDLPLEDTKLQIWGYNNYLFPKFDPSGFAKVHVKEFPLELELKHPRLGKNPGHVVVARQTVHDQRRIEMALNPLTVVSGKLVVVDSDVSAANVWVRLQSLSDTNYGSNWGTAVSDERGEFQIECSRDTHAELMLAPNADYVLPSSSQILIDHPGAKGVILPDVLVESHKAVKIRIVDDEDDAVEGALIVYGNKQFAKTDGAGHATLRPREKFELLRVYHPTLPLCYFSSWTPIVEGIETIALQPEVEIKGAVVDLEGNPIPNTLVYITLDAYSEEHNTQNTYSYVGLTDDDGEYRIHGLSDQDCVIAAHSPVDEQLFVNPRSNSLSTMRVDRKLIDRTIESIDSSGNSDFRCQEWWNGQLRLRDHVHRIVVVREFPKLSEMSDKDLLELEQLKDEYESQGVAFVAILSPLIARKQIEETIQRLKLSYSIGWLAEESFVMIQNPNPMTRVIGPTAECLKNTMEYVQDGELAISIRNAILYPSN